MPCTPNALLGMLPCLPQGRSNVTEINSRLDWQLELALQYTPIT